MVAASPHHAEHAERNIVPRNDAALGVGTHFAEHNQITHHDNHALAAGKYEASKHANLGDHFPPGNKVLAGLDGEHAAHSGHKSGADAPATPAKPESKPDSVKSETADKVVGTVEVHPVSTAGNDTLKPINQRQQTDTTTSYAMNDAPASPSPASGRGIDSPAAVEPNRPTVSPEVAATQTQQPHQLFPARNDMVG